MTDHSAHIQTASDALNLVRAMVLAVDDSAGVERIDAALAFFDTLGAPEDAQPSNYRNVRGILPHDPDGPSVEERVRRLRGGGDAPPVALDAPDGLRPCPFCGGEAKLLKEVRTHYVVCKHCGAGTHGAVDSDIAREQWHKRTTPSATPIAPQPPAPQWAYSGPATIDVYGGGLLKMRLDGPEFPQGAPQSGVHDITLTLEQPRTA